MRNPTYPHSKWTDSPHKERKVIKMNGLTCDLDGFDEKTAKVCGQSGINNSSFPISLDEKKLLPSPSMVSPLESVSLYPSHSEKKSLSLHTFGYGLYAVIGYDNQFLCSVSSYGVFTE